MVTVNLVAGNLALDFTNTAGGRDSATPVEHLAKPAALAAWAVHAKIVARPPHVTPALLRRAIALREAVHRIGTAIAGGAAPPAADLGALRQAAGDAMAEARLTPTADGHWRLDFAAAPAAAMLLGPVAWSALELLANGPLARLKRCPAADCGWLFLDTSRNGARRWCDMATCGNRAKVRQHRVRTPSARAG